MPAVIAAKADYRATDSYLGREIPELAHIFEVCSCSHRQETTSQLKLEIDTSIATHFGQYGTIPS